MYTYYTLSTLKFRWATALKPAMTAAQITQLFVGVIVASLYHLIRYSPAAYRGAAPTIGGDIGGDVIKNSSTSLTGLTSQPFTYNWDALSASDRIHTVYTVLFDRLANPNAMLTCCATTPQAIAVTFNVLYLIPLNVLFVRFYIQSYKRTSPARRNVSSTRTVKVE